LGEERNHQRGRFTSEQRVKKERSHTPRCEVVKRPAKVGLGGNGVGGQKQVKGEAEYVKGAGNNAKDGMNPSRDKGELNTRIQGRANRETGQQER